MESLMLRRFDSIKDCGIFENFRWNSAVPDFERLNLIYGANGAGKTSLSRAIDGLRSENGGFTKVSTRMSNADKSNDRQSNQAHDTEFERIFVFSDGYVARSHDFGGDTEVEAVLTLGERTVEDEKRINELSGLIETAIGELTNAAKASRDADKALDDEHTTIARGVVTALGRAGGEYRSNGSYSKGTVKTCFAGSRTAWTLLSGKDKDTALATVNSDERQTVATKSHSLAIRAELPGEAALALTTSPVSVVLDTLKEHEEASSWVESGRHIHKGLTECIFCGGDLTEDRKKQIEQHFSDEVEEAQWTTDALIREIKTAQASLQSLLGDGAIAGSLFDDLREGFKIAHADAKTQSDELGKWLKGLLAALEKKRANVVARVEYDLIEAPAVDGSKIEQALKDHNDRVSEHATLVQQAAKKVELHLLKEFETKVTKLEEKAKEATGAKGDLEETLTKYREEVAALENVEGDPLPSADVMAKELTRILGRNELSFELLPDGKHYRVTRYGQPARDLSTGERTAITLIHFLENVKRANAHSGKPIVVIDDPVSSLDSGAAMGISTYIWSETISKDHIQQVFLQTHNFELFRQWDIQIGLLPGKRGSSHKSYPSNCYELIAPHQDVNGTKKRVPAFIVWPPNEDTRLKVRSSYHHAFITAARAHAALVLDSSMEKKLDALLLYPNVLRRMLETFLAFKSPTSVGNFTNAMRDIGATLEDLGYTGDADALRLQLTRFTHANSHAESPETDVAVNPDEVGAVIAAVFTFMNAVDQQHFEGLCEVIGVEPSDLLLEAQPVMDLVEEIEEV
ncbi:AAA family ATPase [Arthrobacter sp. H14]|uniref:AAA family ATPase n=1 Tax=Arthrobacter sp. H14 TaxID=1312959 RepID=UPI0020A69851|nr:AAA family ATPase [Arthrobacter sp. H14]